MKRSFRMTMALTLLALLAGCQWVENIRCRWAACHDDCCETTCCETTCCDDGCCAADCGCVSSPSAGGALAAPAPETPQNPPGPRADGENACNGEFNPVNDADAGSRSVQRDAVSATRR